jgi:nucleotide-binding universal stress UspA family protein
MQQLFKTILIPVDFTVNTECAINKGLEMANPDGFVIHLLHIVKPSFGIIGLGKVLKDEKDIDAETKLAQWKESIEDYQPLAKVCCSIECGASIQQVIIDRAFELHPDLIVLGKQSSHSWMPMLNTVVPSAIAKETGCAVLTVKPGSLHNRIRKVVVAVNDNIAAPKMEAIAALCRNNRIQIYLVTFVNGSHVPEDFSAHSLLSVYQWLKTVLHCPVEYAVLHGSNRARAILEFAEKAGADMVLLNPDYETRIGWPDRHISDVISPASRVQVLTVGPAIHS